MIKKIVTYAAAAGFVASGTGVAVVALSYALYALLRESLTPAASSAIVAAVFAAVLLIAGLAMMAKGRGHKSKHEPGLKDRALAFARDKPLIAGGAALAASFLALRNPGMVATLIMGLMAPTPGHRR